MFAWREPLIDSWAPQLRAERLQDRDVRQQLVLHNLGKLLELGHKVHIQVKFPGHVYSLWFWKHM
jgi:hypothetical protein